MTENAHPAADQIRLSVKELVASVTERELDEVPSDARLKEDLGVDSLLAMELMLLIDKKFGIEIPDEEFDTLLTVDDAVPVVQRHLAESALSRGA
jgi:acyl carrier protein